MVISIEQHVRRLSTQYQWLLVPLAIFLITRSAILIGGVAGRLALQDLVTIGPPQSSVLVEIWNRWDSDWYKMIATEGYSFQSPEVYSPVVFFPVYPLMIKMAMRFFQDPALTGVLISHLCLLLALILLYRLVLFEGRSETMARRTILYLSVFPMAFYFGAIYTESAFLLFAVGCIYFARRRLWLPAALFGMVASATRVVGIALYGALLLEWWSAYGSALRDRSTWRGGLRGELGRALGVLAIIQLSALGLLLYMLYLQNRFGNPLLFIDAQEAWDKSVGTSPFRFLTNLGGSIVAVFQGRLGMAYVVAESLAGLVGLAVAPFVWRRYGTSYAVFLLLCSLPVLLSGRTTSATRYALVMFPLFMLLAEVTEKKSLLHEAILVSFCIMLGVFFTIFVNGGWVA